MPAPYTRSNALFPAVLQGTGVHHVSFLPSRKTQRFMLDRRYLESESGKKKKVKGLFWAKTWHAHKVFLVAGRSTTEPNRKLANSKKIRSVRGNTPQVG